MRPLPLSELPKLTPSEKLRIAMELAEVGYEMMREKLRREHPDESDEQIQERLTAWLHHRPGAEYGDCVGRPVTRDLGDA